MPTSYACVQNGKVVGPIYVLPDGYSIETVLHPDILPDYIVVPSGVDPVQGWSYVDGTFSPPPPVALSKAQLLQYAFVRQNMIAHGGASVNVGTSSAPLMIACATDVVSLSLLATAVSVAAANPSGITAWVPTSGSPVTLSAAQVEALNTAVAAFIQSTFATLAAVAAAINAGTITTEAQIDAAAWPANS